MMYIRDYDMRRLSHTRTRRVSQAAEHDIKGYTSPVHARLQIQ